MDVSPDKQNVDQVFSNTAYYIDFYQRDYRWTHEPVQRLLDDIFHKFNEQYGRTPDLDPGPETIRVKYPWYYLNTYVTNTVGGRMYVVDGQQRLTTLSLVLIKLRHMAHAHGSKLEGWINGKIAGQTGFQTEFWMNHVGHRAVQQQLHDGIDLDDIDVSSGITARNMVQNYKLISQWLDESLESKHKFETFVFYFMHRLVLINLAVEQTDVAMVFEVINDRGVRLRPYEILKGKLLGQIDKLELDHGKYNQLWEDAAASVNAYGEDELDGFFRFYLKAKFSTTRKMGQRFDGDYHRAMFSSEMDASLGLLHNPAKVKTFLKTDFSYYTRLYARLQDAYWGEDKEYRDVFYCRLLDIDAPFLLTLSACVLADPAEDKKIKTVAHEIDRLFSLLQLQSAYDSNEFGDSLYRISQAIRGQDPEGYRKAFDDEISKIVAARRNVQQVEPFTYSAFKQTGINLNTSFKRYFFGRVDEFIAQNTNMAPKHSLEDLVTKTGAKTGFHVEHILSENEENLSLFDGDEERFDQERNRLGGILLLKGKDNISSSNETYAEKLKSYANTLYWNETLREDTYKSKLDLREMKAKYGLDLRPLPTFGPEEIESRHRLLFEISRIIWA